jgi:hypothetical protein
MSITVNNGVANILGTPGIIQDSFVNLPAAADVANGTIFIDNVSLNILINVSGVWNLLYAAAGSTPDLQHVTTAGATTNVTGGITIEVSITDVGLTILDSSTGYVSQYTPDRFYVTENSTLSFTEIRPTLIKFITGVSGLEQYLYPNPTFANQKSYLPENDGTLALQNPPFISTISTAAVTVDGTKNGIYRVATGAVTVTLQPSNWVDRKTLTFCVEASFTFVATGGATIKGVSFVNKTGLFYATYLQSFNTFYISHV